MPTILILLRKIMFNSIGSGTTTEFIANEFGGLVLKDKRLNKRAEKILSTLQRKLGRKRLYINNAQCGYSL